MSKERRAIKFAGAAAITLIIVKTAASLMTGSMAILTSAIDSGLDFIVSLMNFFAIKKSEEPQDEDHNYGHGKIEGFGAIFEGVIIFASGSIAIWIAVWKLMTGDVMKDATESIFVMIFSIVVTGLLVRYLSQVYRETHSLVIKADSLHYRSDLYTNLGIIGALIAIKITGANFIDPIIGIIISLYIMYGSINVMKEGYDMLMDRTIEPGHVERIIAIIGAEKEIVSHHFLKTRKSGKSRFIEFHVVFRNPDITLKKAHTVSDRLEDNIIRSVPGSHVTIHLDYFDDSLSPMNPKLRNGGLPEDPGMDTL